MFLGTRQAGPGSTVYRALWAPAHSHPPPSSPPAVPPGPGVAGTFLSRGANSSGPSWGAFVPLLTSIPCGRSHRPLGPHTELWALASVRREQPEKALHVCVSGQGPNLPPAQPPGASPQLPHPLPPGHPPSPCSNAPAPLQTGAQSFHWLLFHLFCSKLKQGTGLSVESPGYHILGTSQIDPRVSPRSESLLWTFLPLRHRLAQMPSPRP